MGFIEELKVFLAGGFEFVSNYVDDHTFKGYIRFHDNEQVDVIVRDAGKFVFDGREMNMVSLCLGDGDPVVVETDVDAVAALIIGFCAGWC